MKKLKVNGEEMKVIACGVYVLLEQIDHGEERIGNLIIPDTAKDPDKMFSYKIVSVGPKAIEEAGMDLHEGDLIRYIHAPQYGEVNLIVIPFDDKKELRSIPGKKILAVMRPMKEVN